MSRQYLNQLKQRAQRLLQHSSECSEDQQQINAYTATYHRTKSPKGINLQQYLHEDDEYQPQQVSQFQERQTTDIELLKRCVSLTNQNNNLKFLVQKLENQVQGLKRELKNKNENEIMIKRELQKKNEKREDSELYVLEQAMKEIQQQKQEIQRQKINLRKKIQQFESEKIKLKQGLDQLQRIRKDHKIIDTKKQIQIQNDYTIRNNKRQDSDRLRFKNQQLQNRIKKLQEVIKEEKNKVNRLCKFINKEVTDLNTIIVQLTAKMDAKLQKIILRDIDI